MKKEITITDRVTHEFLGEGTVVRLPLNPYSFLDWVLVKFDVDPPIRYNCGNNPCWIFRKDLKCKQ